ncbi:MAG: lysophospholipid acyltransferase family protein [Candidatus Methylomirabilales bacterium]
MSLPQGIALSAAALLLAGGAFAALAWARRGPEDRFPTALLRLLLHLYMGVWHRLRLSPCPAGEPIPRDGAAIVVANHRSGVDPLALACCTSRVIHFLMAREYYETPGIGWICRAVGAIPVNRDGNDLGATKAALKALRAGSVIGIFPEGGIRVGESEEQAMAKSGVALLALRSGATVVPAHIAGTPNYDSVLRAFLTPSRSRVRLGQALRFDLPDGRKPSREEMDLVAEQILERIRTLGEG